MQPFASLIAGLRRQVDDRLLALLADKRRQAAADAPQAAVLVDALVRLIEAGGKRLRPALVIHGYLAGGGQDEEEAFPLALATELLHAYLLVHDDIMDHSAKRRGIDTAHLHFAADHRARGLRGDAADHGRSVAILIGDLAASYAAELAAGVETADTAIRRRLTACWAVMTQEVIHGQYLELLVGWQPVPEQAPGPDDLRRVLQLKSGRYTVERPLELGATLAGAAPETLAALKRYGAAVGEVFQLQDDLLGIFGDSRKVGKPVGGDLAEGKHTFLIHHTLAAATPAERRWLAEQLGNEKAGEAETLRLREIAERCGALSKVQEMVERRLAAAARELAALRSLAPLPPPVDAFLSGLLDYSRERNR